MAGDAGERRAELAARAAMLRDPITPVPPSDMSPTSLWQKVIGPSAGLVK
jgi:hypothetical protein